MRRKAQVRLARIVWELGDAIPLIPRFPRQLWPQCAPLPVIPTRVQREVPKQLAVLGDHADVQAVHEQRHALALVRVAHPDMVQARSVTECDLAVLVDPVAAHPNPSTDPDLRA
jgi:hypothetical protein